MKKNQRKPSRRPGHLEESVSTLRDAAKDLVLDATRLWREQNNAWTERVLASAFDVLSAEVDPIRRTTFEPLIFMRAVDE